MITLNGKLVVKLEVDGVNSDDYPDFCDAFFSYAEFVNGTPLNDDELESLGEEYGEMINQLAQDQYNDGADHDYDTER